MHILAGILWFVVMSVLFAAKGDWSGIKAIGSFLLYGSIFVLFLLALAYPLVMVILIIIIFVVIVIANTWKK